MPPSFKNESDDLEAQLVRSAQQSPEGDSRAFEQLVQLHQKRVLANCRYLTRDETNFEDLAQDVFVKAYFGIRKFEGQSTFGHWLRRIKVNHCLNHLKQRERKTAIGFGEEILPEDDRLRVEPTVEKSLEDSSQRQRVGEVLKALPLTLRVPLVMTDMDDFSYDEVASALGISLSAVKMRIKRAREEFRRLYQEPA